MAYQTKTYRALPGTLVPRPIPKCIPQCRTAPTLGAAAARGRSRTRLRGLGDDSGVTAQDLIQLSQPVGPNAGPFFPVPGNMPYAAPGWGSSGGSVVGYQSGQTGTVSWLPSLVPSSSFGSQLAASVPNPGSSQPGFWTAPLAAGVPVPRWLAAGGAGLLVLLTMMRGRK